MSLVFRNLYDVAREKWKNAKIEIKELIEENTSLYTAKMEMEEHYLAIIEDLSKKFEILKKDHEDLKEKIVILESDQK